MNDQPSPELLELIEAACNGELTTKDVERLEGILDADPTARRFYMRCMALDADLWLESGSSPEASPVPEAAFGPEAVSVPAPARRRSRKWIAAAAALVIAGMASLWLSYLVELRVFGGQEAARLTRLAGARWSEAGAPDGDALFIGQRLELAAGLAEVTFNGGARAILEGPATLEVESSSACRLAAGRLAVTGHGDAGGFAVITPRARIVEVGAEFGVEIDARGATEIHVFRGEVDVEPAGGEPGQGSAARRSIRVRGGEALRVSAAGHEAIGTAFERFHRNERFSLLTARMALQDDFSTGRIDPQRWRVFLPAHDSGVRIDGGRVEFLNRGYLVTAEQYDPVGLGGVRITGTWRFAPDEDAEGNARIDILSVMTRSDARTGRHYYEVRSGIEFQLLSHELVPRIRALGPHIEVTRATNRGELHAAEGELLEFEVIDDGHDLCFTVRRAADRSHFATAKASVIRDAEKRRLIVIHNRENPSRQRHVSYLQDVVISTGVGPCP